MTDCIDLDHSSTRSLNCGSDFKEVHCIQQPSVAKLSRSDLEDLYYQLHDENIEVKKKFNNLDNKYKIMATRVMRLSRDHKCIDSIDREEDQQQLQQLRQNEAALRAKLTVLRGQLASHTRLHSAALSKVQRPRSHRCSCHSGRSSCGRDEELLLDMGKPRSQSQSRYRSTSQSTSQQPGSEGAVGEGGGPLVPKNENELARINCTLREELAHSEERIVTLQKEMLAASEQSRQRILDLESELGTHLAKETEENVELIKARRANKQQEAAITSLQHEHQIVRRELLACKTALTLAAKDQDEMCSTLMRERQRNTDLQQEIVKLSQTCSSMRDIEEQLNDAKKENAILKEHSNRLLQLTTGVTDTLTSPRCDTKELMHVTSPTNNQDQLAILQENTVIEQKLETLKLHQSHLQQELKEAQKEVTAMCGKILDAKEERNTLKEEHNKIQSECSKLRMELSEPNEERRRLTQQLGDIRSECARLIDEISKWKSDLEQQQREKEELHQAAQEMKTTPRISGTERGPFPGPASPAPSLSSRPLFHTPQLSARSSHYMSASQSHSHPSTPRPRVGDACLALLEQTAIRPTSAPFPGVLGAHGSLQERFLELCIPANSVTSSCAPEPPVTGDEAGNPNRVVQSMTSSIHEDTSHFSNAPGDYSPKSRVAIHTSQSIGQSNTQWELDKCRELLRVQFNLNSIYKKEVASLSNIVQSLTSDASK